MSDPRAFRRYFAYLAQFGNDGIERWAQSLDDDALGIAAQDWEINARSAQIAPDGAWSSWLILAGRGFGKTRAGAGWIHACANLHADARMALIGATAADARAVMVEGESGLLATVPPDMRLRFEPSKRRLIWSNGAQATLYSAEEPDALRGPQFHYAWGDEAARWPSAVKCLANVRMALRLGKNPQLLITTTPRPLRWLKAMIADPACHVVRGRTRDNAANLPLAFLEAVEREYGGTRLGRQELDGEMIEDQLGALWTRAIFEKHRLREVPSLTRIIVAVDPPAGAGENADACGIIAAGLGADGRGYVLGDRSVQGVSPDNWARAVVACADEFAADRVVAEVNNGGAMVEQVLRSVECNLPYKAVHASRGKIARAEPVAALYARGRVSHIGVFPALEDELCAMISGGVYAGPGRSPDRADALVWALSELMLGAKVRVPGVRVV
jgi:phage terminase large subunit-like protein